MLVGGMDGRREGNQKEMWNDRLERKELHVTKEQGKKKASGKEGEHNVEQYERLTEGRKEGKKGGLCKDRGSLHMNNKYYSKLVCRQSRKSQQ